MRIQQIIVLASLSLALASTGALAHRPHEEHGLRFPGSGGDSDRPVVPGYAASETGVIKWISPAHHELELTNGQVFRVNRHIPLTAFARGEMVNLVYHNSGGTLHATNIEVV